MIDRLTFRLLVVGMLSVALGGLLAGTVLVLNGRAGDAGPAWTIATAALTGVGGLLVNPRTEPNPNEDTGAAAVEGYRQAVGDVASLAVTATTARPKRGGRVGSGDTGHPG